MTTYALDSSGFESQQRHEIFLFSKTVQIESGAHPASHSIGTGVLSQRCNGGGANLTPYLHLVPRLRMSGATPLSFPCLQGQERENFTFFIHEKQHFFIVVPCMLFRPLTSFKGYSRMGWCRLNSKVCLHSVSLHLQTDRHFRISEFQIPFY